jgi:GxxExxY protein
MGSGSSTGLTLSIGGFTSDSSTHYRSDFVCYDDIIVELKALARLGDGELAQVLNCLKASRRTRALLMNFGSKSLQHERLI